MPPRNAATHTVAANRHERTKIDPQHGAGIRRRRRRRQQQQQHRGDAGLPQHPTEPTEPTEQKRLRNGCVTAATPC
jgi:hypothetical protein